MFRVGQKVFLKPVDKCKDRSRFSILNCMEPLFGKYVTIAELCPGGYSRAYKIKEDKMQFAYEDSWFKHGQRSE